MLITQSDEQFRFFTEALRVNKLRGYVDQMVSEAEVVLISLYTFANICLYMALEPSS